MKHSIQRTSPADVEPVRILGRGLRAARGVRLTLKTVREAVGKTQVAVSEESQINQGDISRLESRADFDDCQVSTLRRYLESIGGTLDLVAVFGDKRITISGAEPTKAKPLPARPALPRSTLPRASRKTSR
jgi:hypothetical protein